MCKAEGCNDVEKRGRKGYCEKHYMRMYRNGTTADRGPSSYIHSQGYVVASCKGHPLAKGLTHHYEHRVVFYDAHGAGPFKCQWCGVEVTWSDLHIDHLNDVKNDNRIDNLLPSCPQCNQQRGRHKASGTWAEKTGIEAFGERKTLSQWSRQYGISRAAIQTRIDKGWPVERAISEGRGKCGPKSKPADCNLGKSNKDATDWR